MKVTTAPVFILLLLFQFLLTPAFTQEKNDPVAKEILYQDSLFWTAFNSCNVDMMVKFMSDDLEFYHDKGGTQIGVAQFRAVTQKNLCSNEKIRIRREAVKGSLKVYPMKKGDSLYGAILSGEHVFYIVEAGKKEKLDGLAKFTHLWILSGNTWKMSRVLSYDHGPAPHSYKKTEITLPSATLDKYTGTYKGPKTGNVNVTTQNDLLILTIGAEKFELHPQSKTRFFMVERDLEFEFVVNYHKVTKLVVWENGAVAEELMR